MACTERVAPFRPELQNRPSSGLEETAGHAFYYCKRVRRVTDHERKSDSNRAEAIRNKPTPDNVTKLHSFLGLANYSSMYIPETYDLRAPLNELLKKGKNWYWTKECEKAFKELKKCS